MEKTEVWSAEHRTAGSRTKATLFRVVADGKTDWMLELDDSDIYQVPTIYLDEDAIKNLCSALTEELRHKEA